MSDLNEATEERARAVGEAQEFHNQAAQYRAQGGIAGGVSATLAEGTAVGIMAKANSRLSDAQSQGQHDAEDDHGRRARRGALPGRDLFETKAKVSFTCRPRRGSAPP